MPTVLTYFVALIAISLTVIFISNLIFELGGIIVWGISVSKKTKDELIKENPKNLTITSKSFIFGLLAAFFWALIIAF